MEKQIEAWLKTYGTEDVISPADWADLPEECRRRLDNFARDEAVHRADEFAREGHLDLDRQDAVGQLVDAMAQAWKLPARKVKVIVEDFLDELPPRPGEEFNKLANRMFRRRVTATWKELLETIDLSGERPVVGMVLDELDIDRRRSCDKRAFLDAWKQAYDRWTLEHPKEAVNEVIETLGDKVTDKDEIHLANVLSIIRQRGAATWVRALELEQEVGVDTASESDLIRILKRFALLVSREGMPRRPDSTEKTEAVQEEPVHAPERIEKEVETEEAAEETSPEKAGEIEEDEVASAEPSEPVEPEPIGEAQDEPTTEVVGEEMADTAQEEELQHSDREAASALFGGAKDEEELEIAESSDETEDAKPGEGADEETSQDLDQEEDVGAAGEAEEPEERPEAEEEADDARRGGEDTDAVEETEEETVEEPDAEDAEARPEEIIEPEDEEEPDVAEEVLEDVAPEEAEEEQAPAPEGRQRLQDVFTPTPHEDKRDRFARLRSGDLRERIVEEMYDGDETLLDVFLAKLSGAPDWNRAKQFIANEFFRCKLDLHSDLGEDFFMVLKESLSDEE